jgi:hypothetical protein
MSETSDRQYCGWRIRSEIPLPSLPPWPDDGHAVDIEIRRGAVAAAIQNPRYAGPVVQLGQDGTCRFSLPAIGAFLLRDGRDIVVDVAEGVPDADVRLFLFGSVFGLLCHQRGLLPLHASAVLIDGRAVAFSGPSGVGKSTLAAAFVARGYPLVCDDVLVVDPQGTGEPVVRPGVTQMRLWHTALEALGHSTDSLERPRATLNKYVMPSGTPPIRTPLSLAAVIHLETVQTPQHAACTPLAGLEAVSHLRDAVYRAWLADRMGEAPRIAANCLRLAAGLRLHTRLSRLHDFEKLPATVDRILAMLEAGPA